MRFRQFLDIILEDRLGNGTGSANILLLFRLLKLLYFARFYRFSWFASSRKTNSKLRVDKFVVDIEIPAHNFDIMLSTIQWVVLKHTECNDDDQQKLSTDSESKSSQFLVVFNISSAPKKVPSFYSGKFCARSFTIQVLYTPNYSSSLMRNGLLVLLISSVPQIRYGHELIPFHGIEKELWMKYFCHFLVTSILKGELSMKYRGNVKWMIVSS
jgi:hypothetical protein